MLVIPELNGFYERVFPKHPRMFIFFGMLLIYISRSEILKKNFAWLFIMSSEKWQESFQIFWIIFLASFFTPLHYIFAYCIEEPHWFLKVLDKRKTSIDHMNNTILASNSLLTKSRNCSSSLIWSAIDVNIYFGCYSDNVMLQVLMNRLKIEKVQILWRLPNTGSCV